MKLFPIPVFLCLLLAMNTSCKKSSTGDDKPDNAIQVSLKANETYQYNLGSFGDEEGASIAQQATHFKTSSVTRDQGFSIIHLNYTPADNYTGTDELIVLTAKGSNGTSENPDKKLVKFRFTITK